MHIGMLCTVYSTRYCGAGFNYMSQDLPSICRRSVVRIVQEGLVCQ